jgi:hypothetical protein
MAGMNVSAFSIVMKEIQAQSLIILFLIAIPNPGRHLSYLVEMHPHLRNPSKFQHRGRLVDNTSAVLSSLRVPLSRPLHAQYAVEYHAENILHLKLYLHPLPYVTGLCAYTGT